ncbi:MAG: TetR/AcrR family transcriptional regulator [Planctomycetota bacterium]
MVVHQTTMVRRAQIAEAAGKLIVKRGSENLTIKGIATEVGISEAAIYRHFRSKKDVLMLLADQVGETLVSDINDAAFAEANSITALETALNKHLSAIERRRGISFQVISEIISLGDRELNERACEALNKYVLRLERILAKALKQGVLKDDIDVGSTARLISAIIQGLVNTWVLKNYSINLKAEFMGMWKVLSRGIVR